MSGREWRTCIEVGVIYIFGYLLPGVCIVLIADKIIRSLAA